MCNRDELNVSHISETHLDLVSSECDSGVSQVPPSRAPNNLATNSKFQTEAFDSSVCEQRIGEDSDDNEPEEINFNLDQESQNDQNITNCDISNDIELSASSNLEFKASDTQWDLDETLDEDSFRLGVAHGSLRGDSLDARVLNPDVIQSELDKYYTNISFHDGEKRQNLNKRNAKKLKEFQENYTITPGSVPKPPGNLANFSDLPITENPKRRLDKRISMTEKLNRECTNMERERKMAANRDREEEELLELLGQHRGEFGEADCESYLAGQAYSNEPQKSSPHGRQYPQIMITRPSIDLLDGAITPVDNNKYLSIKSGVNFKPVSRLRRNPDEDQNIPVDSCSTLDESFRNDAIPVCDRTYIIAKSPVPRHIDMPGTSNTVIEIESCSSDTDDDVTPSQPYLRRSPEHSKESPVRIVPPTYPRDASPRRYPAQIRGAPNRPEAPSARPRIQEIYQQVQTFFDNRKEPPTGRAARMHPRVRFAGPQPEAAAPVCPRARGIVPDDVIQTGVFYCGINNVCQTNDPPCGSQRERGSPSPSKPPPGKLLPSKPPPNKRPPPGKPPTPPGPRAGGDPRKCGLNRARLRKVPRPLTGPKPKKKKDFNLTEEQKALVLDNYYPGLLHDAVNQNADFNEVARKFITPESEVDGDKAEKGMSLLEAFDTRVKFEQISMKKLLTTAPTDGNKARHAPPPPYKQTHGASSNPTTHDVICEDNVRPTAIVDLQQFVRALPESDPVRAITCLTRAQHLNDYYKEYRAAQLAVQSAPPDKIEQAALFGVRSFQIQSLSSETETVHSEFYKSLELVSYVGVTKPN